MPNWCEGQLKIRGKRENIIKFLETGLTSVDVSGNELDHKFDIGEMYDDGSQSVYDNPVKSHYSFWVNGTRRGFIEDSICCEFYGFDEQVVSIDYKQAWAILPNELADISKKYDIDFKIYGFERGMEFNQDIEIIRGNIIKNEEIKFDDYNWECINPGLGG